MSAAGRPVHNSESTGVFENDEIIGTPFRLVGISSEKEKGWFISMGNNRITDVYNNREEALDLIIKRDFQLIANMCFAICEFKIQICEQNDKNDPQ